MVCFNKTYYLFYSSINMKEEKPKKAEEHFANDDPTEFPHDDMENMAKQAMKKFKSLNS